jgi:hypothetical protein
MLHRRRRQKALRRPSTYINFDKVLANSNHTSLPLTNAPQMVYQISIPRTEDDRRPHLPVRPSQLHGLQLDVSLAHPRKLMKKLKFYILLHRDN